MSGVKVVSATVRIWVVAAEVVPICMGWRKVEKGVMSSVPSWACSVVGNAGVSPSLVRWDSMYWAASSMPREPGTRPSIDGSAMMSSISVKSSTRDWSISGSSPSSRERAWRA